MKRKDRERIYQELNKEEHLESKNLSSVKTKLTFSSRKKLPLNWVPYALSTAMVSLIAVLVILPFLPSGESASEGSAPTGVITNEGIDTDTNAAQGEDVTEDLNDTDEHGTGSISFSLDSIFKDYQKLGEETLSDVSFIFYSGLDKDNHLTFGFTSSAAIESSDIYAKYSYQGTETRVSFTLNSSRDFGYSTTKIVGKSEGITLTYYYKNTGSRSYSI